MNDFLSFQFQRSVLEEMGLVGETVPDWVQEYLINYYIEGTEDTLEEEKREIFDTALATAMEKVAWNPSNESLYDKSTQVRNLVRDTSGEMTSF